MNNMKSLIFFFTIIIYGYTFTGHKDDGKAKDAKCEIYTIKIDGISDSEKAKIVECLYYDIISSEESHKSAIYYDTNMGNDFANIAEGFAVESRKIYNSMEESSKNIVDNVLRQLTIKQLSKFCCDCYNKIKDEKLKNSLINPNSNLKDLKILDYLD